MNLLVKIPRDGICKMHKMQEMPIYTTSKCLYITNVTILMTQRHENSIFLNKKGSTTCHHIKRWIIMYDCEQYWSKFWSPKINRQFAEYHIKKTWIKWKKFTPYFEAKCHFWASTILMVPTVKLKENKDILPLG